jgi:hypothetical protein
MLEPADVVKNLRPETTGLISTGGVPTCTTNLQETWPEELVAVQVTVVLPAGKTEPETWSQLTLAEQPVTTGGLKVTVALAADVITVTFAGQVILQLLLMAVHCEKLDVLAPGFVAEALMKPLGLLPGGRFKTTLKLAFPPESVVTVVVPSSTGRDPMNSSPVPLQPEPKKNWSVIMVLAVAVSVPIIVMLAAAGVTEEAVTARAVAEVGGPGKALDTLGGVRLSFAPAPSKMPCPVLLKIRSERIELPLPESTLTPLP